MKLPRLLFAELVELTAAQQATLLGREEEAIGICAGLLAGGKRAAILIQYTGFMASINAIRAIAMEYRQPICMLVGLLFADSPQDPRRSANYGVNRMIPLIEALGMPWQLARNDERAVIRLEPPNMGSVEISVRHSGGTLQVNIAASHSEVLRQLNSIGDAVRQDLSQKQFNEVAVTVSASNARSLAEGGQQQRQQDAQQQREQQRQPGRALEEGDAAATTFAMLGERE